MTDLARFKAGTARVEEAAAAIARGEFVVVADDEDRENEGDLIIAADDASFSDPVILLGNCGVEYHAHTWELGARKAKEMLFTGRAMSAQEAESIGMVNRVVPREDLWSEALALAHDIAGHHPFALRQAKRAVNQTLDVMGQHAALQSAFDIHHLCHANAITVSGYPVLASLDDMKEQVKKQ